MDAKDNRTTEEQWKLGGHMKDACERHTSTLFPETHQKQPLLCLSRDSTIHCC